MGKELAVTYEVDGSEITLNPGIVMQYLVDDKNLAAISPKEMAKVIMTCQARRLNPFTGDVVVQPRKNRDGSVQCSLVVTKNFFERRAAASKRFRGLDAGIVVVVEGQVVKKRGSAVYAELGEKLIGGWAAVYVDGCEHPYYNEVSLGEYGQGFALWKTKPGTMIRKVAVSQSLREAFPADFGNLYEPEEMGIDVTPDVTPASEVSPSDLGPHERIDVPVPVAPEYEEDF